MIDVRPRLERAFLARYGTDIAPDLTAEVVAWAWEHLAEVEEVDNPAGYLYRVGQSKAREMLRWRRRKVSLPPELHGAEHSARFEPGLDAALLELDDDQRTAVILVHCFGWTQPEVAELLDVELHTVRNRVHRGLRSLRTALGVEP